jgi:protein required for attachment to host cells
MNNWIVVANKSETKVFSANKTNENLESLETIINDSARLKEKDLVSDASGSTMNSATGAGGRGMGNENTAVQHALDQYTQKVVEYIKQGKNNNSFGALVVVAEPGYLGELATQLDKKNLDIAKKIGKELSKLRTDELAKTLRSEILETFPLS